MADLTELAKLELRITATVDQCLQKLKEMQAEAKKTRHEVHELHGAFDKLGHRLGHFGKEVGIDIANRMLGGLGLGGLAAGVAAFVVHTMETAYEAGKRLEEQHVRMEAVLETNQRAVEATMEKYSGYADELAATTSMTDDQAKSLLVLAERFGMTGEAARDAAKEASDLAQALDLGEKSAMRLADALEKGDAKLIGAYTHRIPQLRKAKTDAELIEGLYKAQQEGEKLNDKLSKTTHHHVAQLRNNIEDALGWAFLKLSNIGMLSDSWDALHPKAEKGEKGPYTIAAEKRALLERMGRDRAEDALKELRKERDSIGKDRSGQMLLEMEEKGVPLKVREDFRAKALAVTYDTVLKKVQDKARYAGMSADEAERERLAAQGVGAERLKELQALQEKAELLSKLPGLLKGLEEGARKAGYAAMTPEEAAAAEAKDLGGTDEDSARARRWKHEARMGELLKDTIEDLKTPQDKLDERMKDLQELLDNQTLSFEQYADAVQRARDKILGLAAAQKAQDQYGSAEDIRRRGSDYRFTGGAAAGVRHGILNRYDNPPYEPEKGPKWAAGGRPSEQNAELIEQMRKVTDRLNAAAEAMEKAAGAMEEKKGSITFDVVGED